ncbi:radical SAM protein [Desulfovibrio inopinatus]|uniref:radical SAM protein n=1 Tax=Desulfovibrio inopinatus TaxID=102109 RepID=UPI00041C483B|nr:radical SAM protein [Desulfovibrio inopinatus]
MKDKAFHEYFNIDKIRDLAKHNQIATYENRPEDLKFHQVSIELERKCNLACQGCFAHMDRDNTYQKLDFDEIIQTIDFAKNRGATLLVLAGAGEPTLDNNFKEIVQYTYNKSMSTILFTNGTTLDESLAHFIFDHDVSVVVKKYAVDDKKHDFLIGKEGLSIKMQQGFDTLLNVKQERKQIGEKVSGVAIDCYISKNNIDDVKEVLRFSRINKVDPHIDAFITSNNDDLSSLSLNQNELNDLLEELKEIDSLEYGIDTTLHPGSRVYGVHPCMKNKVNFSVLTNGDVRDCVCGDHLLGNIRENSLDEIFNTVNAELHNTTCCCSLNYQPNI